jgi:TatD DNase family protein
VAQKFLDLGGYIGFNGIITFDKTGNMEQVVKAVPLERIVLETDSPYLAPTPYRGKRNEPVYIVEVAKKIAEWKSIGLEQLGATTTRNAQELFRLTWQDGG